MGFVIGFAFVMVGQVQPPLDGQVPFRKLLRFSAMVVKDNKHIRMGFLVDSTKRLLITHFDSVYEKDNKKVLSNPIVYFPIHENGVLVVDESEYLGKYKERGIATICVYKNMEKDLAILELEKIPPSVEQGTLAMESPQPGTKLFSISQKWTFEAGSVRQVFHQEYGYPDDPKRFFKGMTIESQTTRFGGGAPMINEEGKIIGMLSRWDQKDEWVGHEVDISEIHYCINEYNKKLSSP